MKDPKSESSQIDFARKYTYFNFLVPQRSNNEKEEEDQIMFADAVD